MLSLEHLSCCRFGGYRSELELKFKRGEINTQEYLEQSGAVSDYLSSQGAVVLPAI